MRHRAMVMVRLPNLAPGEPMQVYELDGGRFDTVTGELRQRMPWAWCWGKNGATSIDYNLAAAMGRLIEEITR